MTNKLLLIYWDQCSLALDALKQIDANTRILMIESYHECNYVAHHKKKLVFLLSSQRHFAEQLKKKKYKVDYLSFNQQQEGEKVSETLAQYQKKHPFGTLIVTEPGEYRQQQEIKAFCRKHKIKLEICTDNRFFCTKTRFSEWAKPFKAKDKKMLMENFYHVMRKETGYLMEDQKPAGGKWNYDSENRLALATETKIPKPKAFKTDEITQAVIKQVKKHFPNHFGDIAPFALAVTSTQAKSALKDFIKNRLPHFGPFQDAMLLDEAFLYHSLISFYINNGLLLPSEVCDAVEKEYYAGNISLNTAEGFIRQIIGWREFVRGIYWLEMPGYVKLNALNYQNPLPPLYWTGETKMQCLAHTIKQTKEHAYSHHIQRLMITGNFASLIGVKPKDIHEWYLIVYADAFEWVELPNTVGMATYADGGIVGTKPYISSGNYINKMSNFCKQCQYKVSAKEGDDACPFNYLYWNYLIEHKKSLSKNQRLRMPYATLAKMSSEKIKNIKASTAAFLKKLFDGKA